MRRLALLIVVAALLLFAPRRVLAIEGQAGGVTSNGITVSSPLTGSGSSASPIAIPTPLPASIGGFATNSFPGPNFNANCGANASSSIGPGSSAQMVYFVIYQPTPFSFVNGKIFYSGKTADASVESDACIYQLTGTTLNLIADSGLVAWTNVSTQVALGGGTSNLSTQPTASTCGSGVATCTAGIFPPGYYAVAMASAATTAKINQCTGALEYGGSASVVATSGECPLTVTSVTPSVTSANTPLSIQAW